jgi:hypothetical protein
MGSRGDNGGWPSDGGSPDDLPDLPEEWGVIVIPDDLSELADEVEAIRAELRHGDSPTRWQRFTARPGVRRLRRIVAAGVRAPVLIISMAVLVTVASLFASAWPGPPRTPTVQRATNGPKDSLDTLPAMAMIGSDGKEVALRGQLPAIVMLTDGCDCAQLVTATVGVVRPGVSVITVVSGTGTGAPTTALTPATGATPQAQAQGKTLLALRDPPGSLRASLGLETTDGTAAVLVVNQSGDIIQKLLRTASIEDFRPYLAQI